LIPTLYSFILMELMKEARMAFQLNSIIWKSCATERYI
jgi:hypothetical protein